MIVLDSTAIHWESDVMSLILELDESTESALLSRARHDGVPLNDMAVRLLRAALTAVSNDTLPHGSVEVSSLTGLPVITGGHKARPGEALSPERVAEILHYQEVERYIDSCRQ